MKTFKLAVILLMTAGISTFAQKQEIKKETSIVKWTGNKIGGSHTGEINVKSGYLELKNNQITGGEVVIDMHTITNHDLKDEGYNQKLVGHLKSDDFFGVEKYPTSTFVISEATGFKNGKATVSGKITIKGKTDDISFDVVKKGDEYTALVKVDRSKFDVKYGSNSFFDNLGDKAIDDIFQLEIRLSI